MTDVEYMENDTFGSYHALSVAFKTMKERCQQLQTRLATVEEENVCLRLKCGKDTSTAILKINNNSQKSTLQILQEKIEELVKQKSQLTHHAFMVAAENRQLWNRLMRLTKTNQSLGSQLTKISNTLKQYSATQPSDIMSYGFRDTSIPSKQENEPLLITDDAEKEQSLEEISCRLIKSIILEKSDLEQQYAEMLELHDNSKLNLQNIDFTYPEDSDTHSLEQLKQYEGRLSQTKDILLEQQIKLKRVLQNVKKMKEEAICLNCRKNANKKMCQTGTQSDSDDNLKGHEATQTSLMKSTTPLGKSFNFTDNMETNHSICPICGIVYGKIVPFAEFHEHVLSHFTEDDSFELIH